MLIIAFAFFSVFCSPLKLDKENRRVVIERFGKNTHHYLSKSRTVSSRYHNKRATFSAFAYLGSQKELNSIASQHPLSDYRQFQT